MCSAFFGVLSMVTAYEKIDGKRIRWFYGELPPSLLGTIRYGNAFARVRFRSKLI